MITAGELFTDPAMHGPSKIAGETHFVIDMRSVSDATMDAVAAEARQAAARIGEAYRVSFDLGATSDSPPAVMDARLRARLMSLLDQPFEMPSGAGHDAAVFAKMGIPTAMIFVRNEHGSHNPDEAMAMDDFEVATRALLGLLVELSALTCAYEDVMKLLVTGGTGFVMSVLGRHWLDADPTARLIVLDAAPLDAAAVRYFAPVAERLTVVVADVTQPDTWRGALDGRRHHAYRSRRHRHAHITRHGGRSEARA